MNTFTINSVEYKAAPFDFNLVCDLEDMGISLEDAGQKPMSMVRAYFGLCAKKNRAAAGKELEAHIAAGGKLDDISDAMSDEMEKSDFFRSLSETAEKGDQQGEETEGKEAAKK